MSVQATGSIVNSSEIFSQGIASQGHLTPDGMVLYLQTRLESLDGQINDIMQKQQASEKVRKSLQAIQNEWSKLDAEGGTVNSSAIADELNKLHELDPNLATAFLENAEGLGDDIQFEDGKYVVAKGDGNTGAGKINDNQVEGPKTFIDNSLKDIESSAQLDMIKLQSLISARNTAISLASNIMSAIGKGDETIAGNIRG